MTAVAEYPLAERALAALSEQVAPPGEVVVVDNAPSDDATRKVVDTFPGVRYVIERRPGLSIARNTGVRRSTGAIVAFTDDDGAPHPTWTAQVARALDHPDAPLAMTGLALPVTLESEAAQLFDVGLDAFTGLADSRQQAQRKLAADDGGNLDRPPGILVEAIDAGDEHVLDGIGDGDLLERPCEDDSTLVALQHTLLDQ